MKEYIMRYENEVLQLLPDKIQPLIRCKDCKYAFCINPGEKEKIYECMKYPIANLRITHKPDWFCADGERR